MISKIWTSIIGPPLATKASIHRRLSKFHALGALSPDALSSIAYANEEIYLGLVVAGAAGLILAFPISIAISVLLVLVSLSYYQTIQAYPSGGGSYVVASENLGTYPGLIAAAALMIDYILTAAVSLTAGVAAIASAFPLLWPYRVVLSLVLLVIITLVNLRGLQETGAVISIPVYLFLFTYFPMLIFGVFVLIRDGITPLAVISPPAINPLSLFLVLHAFSAGCTAMTGIEAISNGVQVFKPPESKNAGRTMIIMAVLMATLFLGSIGLTQGLGVLAGEQETILSALARRLFGFGIPYLIIQGSTMLILVVAANTSFAGFPRVAAILAEHGFFPRQFTNLGDRLVFSNGIVSLAAITGLLIIIFNGDTHTLIPLFAVGVFLAFSLSQAGMVIHWYRERGKNWIAKAVFNGLGAIATLLTLLVVGVSKFLDGAWITCIIIPAFVYALHKVNTHYREVAKELAFHNGKPPVRLEKITRVVVPVSGIHRGMIEAVNFAQKSFKEVIALYVELEPGRAEHIRQQWEEWWPDVKFVVRESPYRSVVAPLLDYLDELDATRADGQLTAVVLPEIIPSRWWHNLLHNQSALLIKSALLYRRREHGYQRIIIDIPYHLEK
jgi:amino acid transporter